VNHVERDDRRGGGNRPGLFTDIEAQRHQHIGGPFGRKPQRNRVQTLWVALARLPGQMQRFSREMDDVLPGSASDLEHKAAIGQHLLQHFRDRPLVALA
jgi:hypothetical protein